MVILKPNTPFRSIQTPAIFLAGSIEMGAAENWQTIVESELSEWDVSVFNPRRDDWDSTWAHDGDQFNQQVNWEMNALDDSNIIFMYFSPGTKSPISLLELGLYAGSGKMIVICPEEFWRYGNVSVVCTRYNIPMFKTLKDGIFALKSKIRMIKN